MVNKSGINSSNEFALELFPYSTLIFATLILISCGFGAFGNALSFLIYNSGSMRGSSINSLLAFLSAVDLVLTILAVPVFALPGLNFYLNDPVLSRFYVVVTSFLYAIVLVAQTVSVWTFVLISIERFVAVAYPLEAKWLLTVRRARWAQFAVLVASILYNGVRFFEYEPHPDGHGVRKLLLESRTYFLLYYVSSYLLTHCLGPGVIIFVLNILILRTIRLSDTSGGRRRKDSGSVRRSQRHKKQGRTTRMIVVVTSIFAACNTLPYVINIWEATTPDLFDNDEPWPRPLATFVLDASNTLIVINSSTTFLVYLRYCRKYRLLFADYCLTLIKCRRPRVFHSRRFTSFDSYFSNVDACDFYTTSGVMYGGSSIGGKSVRSQSETPSSAYPYSIAVHREHLLAARLDSGRSGGAGGRRGCRRKAAGASYLGGRRHPVRYSLQVPLSTAGKGSMVSTHMLVHGSIRAAIFASRKSV